MFLTIHQTLFRFWGSNIACALIRSSMTWATAERCRCQTKKGKNNIVNYLLPACRTFLPQEPVEATIPAKTSSTASW